MPVPGTPASGLGSGQAPGPVDQSRHFNVTVNGVDPNRVADNVVRRAYSADREMTYTPPEMG
jgi:hypothetical protein